MVLTSSGQVVTNYHVVQGARTISVTVAATGKTYRATVVGSDQTDDVALLQLSGASGLATVKVDHDQTSVHALVTAVGNAGGAGELTATTGRTTSLKATVTTAAEGSLAQQTLTTMAERSSATLSTHHLGTRVQITWIDQEGDQHTAEATLGTSPLA